MLLHERRALRVIARKESVKGELASFHKTVCPRPTSLDDKSVMLMMSPTLISFANHSLVISHVLCMQSPQFFQLVPSNLGASNGLDLLMMSTIVCQVNYVGHVPCLQST